jgi:hypothetical protein
MIIKKRKKKIKTKKRKKKKKMMMMMMMKEKGYREHGNETSVFIMCCSTSRVAEHQLMVSLLDLCFT